MDKRAQLVVVMVLSTLALAALACSLPGLSTVPTPEVTIPATTEVEPTQGEPEQPTAEPTTPPDPAAVCPQPGEGQALFVNEDDGYCLLYPTLFTINEEYDFTQDELTLIGPALDPNAMEPVLVVMQVFANGPADGLDAAGYLAKWQEVYLAGMEDTITTEQATIGGQAAVVADGIPARMSERAAYIIANGHKYRIVIGPTPDYIPELADDFELAWTAVTESIVFFEPRVQPQVVRPEDVCPQATARTVAHISLADGVCMLVPDTFERDVTFQSGFNGTLSAAIEGWGEMRSNLVLGSFGPAMGLTPRQIVEPWYEAGIDPATVTDATIGGAPAVVFFDTRGPVFSRMAIIVSGDWAYTIVNQPYYPQEFPEVAAEVDLIWETVTGSLAFFDVWK